MTALYELAAQYADAVKKLSSSELDEQTVNDTLDGLDSPLEDKFEAVAMHIQNLLVAASAKKERSKELSEQCASMTRQAEWLNNYLDVNMKRAGKDKIQCKYFDIMYRKLPDVLDVVSVDDVPPHFVKTRIDRSVDKVAAKKAIKDGQKVEGLKLITDRMGLVIK